MTNTEKVVKALYNAQKRESNIDPDVLYKITLPGESMVSGILPHLLNNLVDNNTRYLEIGTWKGTTLVSALYSHNPQYVCVIDSWEPRFGPFLKEHFIKKCETHLKYIPNYIHSDCFTVDPIKAGISNIDVYFYDGEHEFEDHYRAITHYFESLANEFIIVIDDYFYPPVKPATEKAIKDKNIEILFSKELGHPDSSNGLFIGVCRKI